MPPTVKDIAAVRGDTLSTEITAYDAADAILDLTGCTLWFTVKDARDKTTTDDDAITKCYWVSGGGSSGITVSSPSTGVALIDAPAADMAALNPNRAYVYDVQVETATGRYTLVKGNLIVDADVTLRSTTP